MNPLKVTKNQKKSENSTVLLNLFMNSKGKTVTVAYIIQIIPITIFGGLFTIDPKYTNAKIFLS